MTHFLLESIESVCMCETVTHGEIWQRSKNQMVLPPRFVILRKIPHTFGILRYKVCIGHLESDNHSMHLYITHNTEKAQGQNKCYAVWIIFTLLHPQHCSCQDVTLTVVILNTWQLTSTNQMHCETCWSLAEELTW